MEAVPHVRKIVLAGSIAVLAALGTSATAYGGGCNQNVPSSVAQYVEQTPSACGQHATGQGTKSRTVPKKLEQKIQSQGGQDATLLHNIVTKQSYGSPQTKIKVTKVSVKKGHRSTNIPQDSATKKSNPLAASIGVITDGSDGRLIALLVLMVGVAAVVIVSSLRRRRVTR